MKEREQRINLRKLAEMEGVEKLAELLSKTLPSTSPKTIEGVFTKNGVNHGGRCDMCGKNLGFWFIYKRCDQCLLGLAPSRRKSIENRRV